MKMTVRTLLLGAIGTLNVQQPVQSVAEEPNSQLRQLMSTSRIIRVCRIQEILFAIISMNLMSGCLKSKLVDLIRLKGPLCVSEYMKIVLTNPHSGFYMNNDVFGVKGHFTTSPEISQTFSELIGVWIIQEWKRFGCSKPIRLVELGPGRGTLMSDVARTLGSFTETRDIFDIRLIEISPQLEQIQRETLRSIAEKVKWSTHIESLEDDGEGFTAYIAHEFLDALPIHKFVIDTNTGRWRELLIDYDEKHDLRFAISRRPSLSSKLLVPEQLESDHYEACPQASLILENIVGKLNKSGKGCALICDYGFEESPPPPISTPFPSIKPLRSYRDTFRAFKNHQSWPPLKDPGEADLTADVDFGYIKKHLADKAVIFGSTTQRAFLTGCGIKTRLERLIEGADKSVAEDLVSGVNMLLEDMGTRYRFMSLFPNNSRHLFMNNPPAGFNEP